LVQTGTGAVSAQAPGWNTVDGADVSGNITGSAGSVANALTAGTYLTSGGTFDGAAARTFAVDATTTNTASKVVARDASGDFAAGTITATLTGNASTATSVAGGVANQVVYQSGVGTTAFVVAPTASGQVLGWNGSSFAYTTTIASATAATNISGGAANQIAYQSGSNTTTFLANGTTGQILTATTGSAPSWQTSTAASKGYVQAMGIVFGL
jgi:trimeric autotransporter adhesin